MTAERPFTSEVPAEAPRITEPAARSTGRGLRRWIVGAVVFAGVVAGVIAGVVVSEEITSPSEKGGP